MGYRLNFMRALSFLAVFFTRYGSWDLNSFSLNLL